MDNPEEVIPVIEEELIAGKQAVKTGSVRVRKTVEHSNKIVEMAALQDVVQVNRVRIDRVIDSMPQTREEGDTVIVPVVEEQLIVQKRLVLKEEIHIKRSQTRRKVRHAVTVDREHAVVEKLDASGEVVKPAATAPARHKSLLD